MLLSLAGWMAGMLRTVVEVAVVARFDSPKAFSFGGSMVRRRKDQRETIERDIAGTEKEE
jgi:hypothetical protein